VKAAFASGLISPRIKSERLWNHQEFIEDLMAILVVPAIASELEKVYRSFTTPLLAVQELAIPKTGLSHFTQPA
jgi:hypothetical protein